MLADQDQIAILQWLFSDRLVIDEDVAGVAKVVEGELTVVQIEADMPRFDGKTVDVQCAVRIAAYIAVTLGQVMYLEEFASEQQGQLEHLFTLVVGSVRAIITSYRGDTMRTAARLGNLTGCRAGP